MAKLAHDISVHTKDVNGCCFSPNSKSLVSVSGDKTVRLWNVEDGSEMPFSPLKGHTYYVNCCAISPFGTILVTGSTDSTVRIWDTNTGKEVGILEGHKGGVRVCTFSPNSHCLATGSGDETLILWDVASRKIMKRLEGFDSTVLACCFTPDNLYIVVGNSGGFISIWDLQYGKCMISVDAHDMGVYACVFSPTFGSAIPSAADTSGSSPHFLLASGGGDNMVKLWDVYTASAFSEDCNIRSRCVLENHKGQVWCCAFSCNGKLLATGSGDKTVIIWDPIKALVLHIIVGHTRYITSCAFSLDMKWLATGSNDRTLKLWQLTLMSEDGEVCSGNMGTGYMSNFHHVQDLIQKVPKKKLATWTTEEVCEWLDKQGMEQYMECFRRNAIDGLELSNITTDLLANDLGVVPVGHRNKILRSVKDIKREELDENIPDEYLCPITREIMTDPVIAADGYSYERQSIQSWLSAGRMASPMTNAPLSSSTLTPNRLLKTIILRHFTGQDMSV